MQEYTYYAKDSDPLFECPFTIENIWDADDLDRLGEACARDYYFYHDGWEAEWPMIFIIEDSSGNRLGAVRVVMEFEPRFNGSVVNA